MANAASRRVVNVLLANVDALELDLLAGLVDDEDVAIVGSAHDSDEAVELASTCDPEVVVVDVSSRGQRDIRLAESMKNAAPHAAVLAVGVDQTRDVSRERTLRGVGYVTHGVEPYVTLLVIRLAGCRDRAGGRG